MRRHILPGVPWWWLLVLGSAVAVWPTCSGRRTSQRGGELFQQNCAICHQASNLELRKQPPKLEGLFQLKRLPSGAPATDEQVRKVIIEGLGTMPAFDQRLSQEDVDDLLKFLHHLK